MRRHGQGERSRIRCRTVISFTCFHPSIPPSHHCRQPPLPLLSNGGQGAISKHVEGRQLGKRESNFLVWSPGAPSKCSPDYKVAFFPSPYFPKPREGGGEKGGLTHNEWLPSPLRLTSPSGNEEGDWNGALGRGGRRAQRTENCRTGEGEKRSGKGLNIHESVCMAGKDPARSPHRPLPSPFF